MPINNDLRAAVEPFLQIAKRRGWDRLPDGAPELNWHVVDAEADDMAVGAIYVLHVSDFRRLAQLLG